MFIKFYCKAKREKNKFTHQIQESIPKSRTLMFLKFKDQSDWFMTQKQTSKQNGIVKLVLVGQKNGKKSTL